MELSRIEFSGIEFTEMEFSGIEFSGIEFSGIEFAEMEFVEAASAGLEFAESEPVKSEFVEPMFLLSEMYIRDTSKSLYNDRLSALQSIRKNNKRQQFIRSLTFVYFIILIHYLHSF
nr:hypothetical protein [Leptospira alexanderi]